MNRERELKYAAQSTEPPTLPHGWSLGQERAAAEIVDTYLDHAATLSGRGWALRRRETVGAPTRYTLKRNAQQVGAFHQRDEIEREGDQVPAEIMQEIGAQLAAELREVVTMKQRRRSWPLELNGSVVADLTTDDIRSGSAHWTELEIEFVPSVSDAEATDMATELQAFFAGDETLTPSRQSKHEAAIAAL
jgi:inorganic triphosphatase YgiF